MIEEILNMAKIVLIPVLLLLFTVDVAAEKKVVFMIGEREYGTKDTLQEFYKTELAPQGWQANFVLAPSRGEAKNNFPGLENALKDADLFFLSVRRRAPTIGQLNAVREYLSAGKPMIGVRTASHPFDTRGQAPSGHAEWLGFDEEVLGAKYTGHYGDETFAIETLEGGKTHPLLEGVVMGESTKLYKNELSSPASHLLLQGRRENGDLEPVAWTHTYGPQKAWVFYTSLGVPQDFKDEGFRQLLRNAVEHSTISKETVKKRTP